MLNVVNIHTYYGLSHILFDVSITVNQGECVCLLGRNGAGKSTTMRSIMGLTPPRKGSVQFKGTDCTGQKPYRMVRHGMGYVPDDRRVFADLTVGENLEICHRNEQTGGWNKQRVYGFFPALEKIDKRRAGFLSGGEAADADHRPVADDQSRAAASRRTHGRARPPGGKHARRTDRAAQE